MKTQQLKRWLSTMVLSGALMLQAINASARQESIESLFDQFQQQEEVLRLQLEVDLSQLQSDKRGEVYMPAQLSFKDNNRQDRSYAVEVKVRGRFRLMTCDFPPLKIKFSKKDLASQGLKGYNDFKLVTHCMNNLEGTDENLLKEYLSYQLYNEVSGYSFRAKLVKITYKDSKSNDKMTHYGILLEDEEEMAERLGGQLCEDCFGAAASDFDQYNNMTHALFQYMIGNTDWSLSMARNVKLVKMNSGFVTVPFDFDFSGLVNAPYAKPNVDYGLRSLRERYFMGEVNDPQALQNAVALFKAKKKNLMRIIDRANGLSWETKQDLTMYVLSFYEALEDGSFLNHKTQTAVQDSAKGATIPR